MCDECREFATEQILDYVLLGLDLVVAVRLERDAVVQRCLMDKIGEEALEDAVALSQTVTEIGEELMLIAEHNPGYWYGCLELHKARKAVRGT
jgi:hypothetical protein